MMGRIKLSGVEDETEWCGGRNGVVGEDETEWWEG